MNDELQHVDEKLGDGSWCVVEWTGTRSVTVTRTVDDTAVWGQSFDTGPIEEDEWPGERVLEVVKAMRDMPDAFVRPFDSDGRGRS